MVFLFGPALRPIRLKAALKHQGGKTGPYNTNNNNNNNYAINININANIKANAKYNNL